MARKKYKTGRKLYEKKIKIIDKDGVERRKSIYANTKADLEAKVIQAIKDNEKRLFPNKDKTIGEYASEWLEDIERTRSANTFSFYSLSVNHIQESIGTIRLQKLQRHDIQTALNKFYDRPRTAQIFRMTLNQICERAIDDNIINRNPCRGVLLPKYKAAEKRALTKIELDAIKAADLTASERLFISLLYYCGLRRGEALALSRGDIDLKRGLLTINHSLAFPDNRGILKEPKTKKSHRSIPIPAALRDQLSSYQYDLYLFTTTSGDLFSRSAYRKFWARIIHKLNEAAGGGSIDRISGLTAHIFRHNYATWLHNQGYDDMKIQTYLGHESLEVTKNIYTHVGSPDENSVKEIDALFSNRIA